jgi:signal transduction histidine kinase
MQKSKFIALGETISLIAHQWRQPLNELGVIILNIKLHQKLGKLNTIMLNKKISEAENLLLFMSNTIDDFRTFFKPNKIKNTFNLNHSVQRVLQITKAMLEQNNIKTILTIDTSLTINNYQNEFEQVILNLISNAKDAMKQDKILEPVLRINIYKKEKIIIEISDNAHGINDVLIHKIFEPYFTTKDDANGTGIGLYISKIIIEKNMLGKLVVTSSRQGSIFTVLF